MIWTPIRSRLQWLRKWLCLGPGGIRLRWVVCLHFMAFVILVILALRDFLFGQGYVIYHNIVWPIAFSPQTPINSVYSPYLWTNAGPDAGGYTRSVTDAPAIWFGYLFQSPLITQKSFAIYAYLVEYVLSFVAATLFLEWFPTRTTGFYRETLRLGFIALNFVNPAALQWEAGWLLPFFWSVPILEIAFIASLLAIRSKSPRLAVVAGLALGAGATLDPRIFVLGWLTILFLYLGVLIFIRRELFVFGRFILTSLAAVPGALLTVAAYVWAGEAGAPLRPATVASLTGLSSNAGPLRVFELLGYFISEITYAPPTIYAYGSPGSLPSLGNPTYMVLPPDPVTFIWLLALGALPVLAFSSLLFRSELARSLPFAVSALAAILFATGTTLNVPGLVSAEVSLGSAPFVGSVWQTVIGVPIYAQIETEAMYVPLVLITFVCGRRVLQSIQTAQSTTLKIRVTPRTQIILTHSSPVAPRRAPGHVAIFSLVVVLLLFMGSWQFVSGDFYPGGYSVGVSPTGVPAIGSGSPVAVPASDVAVASLLSNDPQPYAVYWPGASGFTYAWSPRSTPSLSLDSPKPIAEPPGLSYLVQQNLTADTASLLSANGIRYVIIDNMSSLELQREFGTSSLNQILRFFEGSPGVELVSAWPPTTWLFETTGNSSIVSAARGELAFYGSSAMAGVISAALGGVGSTAVLVPGEVNDSVRGITFLDNLTALPRPVAATTALVGTGSNLTGVVSPLHVEGFTTPGPETLQTRTGDGESPLPSPYSNWTVSVWSLPSGSVNLTVGSDGTIQWDHSGPAATISLNYLSSLVDGSYQGIPVDPQSLVSFNVSAQVWTQPRSSATAILNVIASNATAVNTVQENSNPYPINTTPERVSFSGTLPLGSAYFTLRLFSTFAGLVDVRNVSIDWVALEHVPDSFSGTVLSAQANSSLRIPIPGYHQVADVGMQLLGGGSISVKNGSLSEPLVPQSPGSDWVIARNIALDSSIELEVGSPVLIGGLVVIPDNLTESSVCTSTSVQQNSFASYETDVMTGTDCYLELHELFSSRWVAQSSSFGTQSGQADLMGQVFFAANSTNSTVLIELQGMDQLPSYLEAYAAVLIAVLSLVVFWPTRKDRSRTIGG